MSGTGDEWAEAFQGGKAFRDATGALAPVPLRGGRSGRGRPQVRLGADGVGDDRDPGDRVEEGAEQRLREHVRAVLAAQLPARVEQQRQRTGIETTPEGHRELARELVEGAMGGYAERELMANRPLVAPEGERRVISEVINELFGMAGLQPLLDDPRVETINANRFDRVFVQYADGRRARVAPIARSNEELTELVRLLAARASSQERRFDHGSPSVNLQLPGGERLFAVMAVTAGGVTSLSIRRHRYPSVDLEQLAGRGTVDEVLLRFLRALVRARKNTVITGGTGAGKTTLLRALAAQMDPMERIVTIEDAFELGLETDPGVHADVTAFQAREPNVEGEGAVSQADLVRWALRMTPDRVIVGEIRGPEVIPMCNAMSQGNDGSMATLHASSSALAFTRLASYAAQGPERLPLEATNLLVAGAVHFVVHLDRIPNGRAPGARAGSRRDAFGGPGEATRVVSSIREVVGADGPQVVSNEVFRPYAQRRARPVPGAIRSDTLDDLVEAGFDPTLLTRADGRWSW